MYILNYYVVISLRYGKRLVR